VIIDKKVKCQELALGWVEHNKKGNSLSRRKKPPVRRKNPPPTRRKVLAYQYR
jgi:hypothetical protein